MRLARVFSPSLALAAGLLSGCGGGGSPSGPSSPSTPTPTPTPNVRTVSVQGTLFYDEDGDGQLSGTERVRLPNVTLSIGGRTGATTAGGHFSFDAPEGAQQVTAVESSLPAYWTVPPVSVTLPVNGELMVPARLPIGRNRPNVYMAFGDSITTGDFSRGGGYRDWLADLITGYWGRAAVEDQGVAGTKSDKGSDRMITSLVTTKPAYAVILYGTNDWNSSPCRDSFPCFTIDALRSMIQQAKAFDSVPVIGTIPPVNPTFTDREAENRNAWVVRMNDLIRPMARQEGAILADVHAAMMKDPSLASLFADPIHPNDSGYEIIGREFFRAITAARGSATTTALERLP